MNQNQIKKNSRLSPLAKPFTFNRSFSYSSPKPSFDDDPFTSLLHSFQKSNLSPKGHSVSLNDTVKMETFLDEGEISRFEGYPFVELPKNGDFELDSFRKSNLSSKGHSVSLNDTVKMETLLDEGGSKIHEISRFEGYPFVELPKNCDFEFDGINWSHFEVPNSVGDVNLPQKVKPAVDELNPCLTVSDGIFGKDILSNSEGVKQDADESSSFLKGQNKVAPLKISTDISSSKSTHQNQLSNKLGDSDTDVDSPCWKGTTSFSLVQSEIPQSVQFRHAENATEKHNTLNPLAPQFFPGIGYVTDDFVSTNSCVPVTTNLMSGEDIFTKTVMAESLVELNKGELQYSTSISGIEKSFNMVNDSRSSSVNPLLNSHCTKTTQSSSKKEFTTPKGKLVTIGGNVDDFVKGTRNPRTSEVFPAKGHSPTSPTSSSQVNVFNDLLKTFEGFYKSLIECPKPDVKIVIGAMHVLSEMLGQTCVNGVASYNEHDLSTITIQQIINNLNDFNAKRGGEKISTSTLDSKPANNPYFLDRSLKLTEGHELANVETLTNPHQLYLENDYVRKDTVSKLIGQSEQSSFASSSGVGTKKGNEIGQLQVIRRSLGKNLDFDKQMRPEELLFWNLWLDSEAERCYRKFKTYHWLMEAGVDVNCNNVMELWR